MLHFITQIARNLMRGGNLFRLWLGLLALLVIWGLGGYHEQLTHGLGVTAMSDQVVWGLYISNFTFLVGIAAAAVVLLIPAYIFHHEGVRRVVLMGESLATTAVIMCLLFVFVDLGRPERIWHALPYLGRLNFPTSILAWDMVVLSGYLLLNMGLGFYLLASQYYQRTPNEKLYFPWMIVSIILGLSIHTITAFMLMGNPARPFWHSALLAPRFIASAFAAGAGLMIILLQIVQSTTAFRVAKSAIHMLALIMTFSLIINLFFLGSEFFSQFYHSTDHALAAQHLYFNLSGTNPLTIPVWGAILASIVAAIILVIHPWRQNPFLLNVAALLTVAAIWIEKGLGLIIPGFIPTPLGEFVTYLPTMTEIRVSLGIWAVGGILFTLLAKSVADVESGKIRADINQENALAPKDAP